MPITRQDVNEDITAKITGKTIAKSITPTEDGANRVLMMDYVDQEIKTKTLKTTIIPSEVRTLNTIPKTILTNSGSEKILYPISVYIVKRAGNGYTMSSRNFAIRNQNNDDVALFDGYSINQSGVNFIQVPINLSHGRLGALYSNYTLEADQAISGGDGDLDVYVTYVEITL